MTEAALEAKHIRAERQLASIRTIIIVFNSAAYLLLDKSNTIPWLAYSIIGLALTYTTITMLLRNQKQPAWILTGYYTSITDSMLISAWIIATGGAQSPYFLLWFISLGAIALRFDLRKTIATAIAYALLHIGIVAAFGQLPATRNETIIRVAYIIFAGLIAGVTSKFWIDEAVARREVSTRITDARAAEAKFRGLLEFSPDPIVVIDASRRITIVNGGAERVFGIAREASIGRPVAELLAEHSREDFARWSDSVLADGLSKTGTFEGRRGDAEFPLEVFTSTFLGEDGLHAIFVMRDIAARQAAEEERVANAAHLKELQRLKEMDRFKTQFINNAAHELGTPLTPIKMQVHILQRVGHEKLEPSQRRAIEVIKRNVDRLGGLVQDVLDAARAQADRLGVQRVPIDINRVVMEAVEAFEESAHREGLTLTSSLAPDLIVSADEKRLTQVLFNLLSNAVKFSPSGTRITVTTTRQGENAQITVADNGIGIDAAGQARLFQPFSQLQDPRERTRAGTGLGLYISRSLIELHGGKLSVHSDGPGTGTTFTVIIPMQTPERSPVPPPAPLRAKQPKPELADLQSRVKELV